MIRVQIDLLLKEQKRSFYWLAKETGVSHTTLWHLKRIKLREWPSTRWKRFVRHLDVNRVPF